MAIDPDILPTFIEEARGYLEVLGDPEAAPRRRVRAAHGLKGSSAMLGLAGVEACAGRLERLLEEGAPGGEHLVQEIERHIDRLVRAGDEDGAAGPPALEPRPPPPASSLEEDWDPETAAMLRELFVEEAQDHMETISGAVLRLMDTQDPAHISEMLRKAHTLKGSASTVGLPVIATSSHHLEETLVRMRDEEQQLDHQRLKQLMHSVDLLRYMTEAARDGDASQEQFVAYQDILRSVLSDVAPRPRVKPAPQELALAARRLPSEAATRWSRLPTGEYMATRAERRAGAERRHDDVLRVRVEVSRLDDLMNTVGEMVIQRTRIEQRVEELKGLARDLSISRRDLHEALTDVELAEDDPSLARIREVDVEVADVVANLERTSAALLDDSEVVRRTTHTLQDNLTQLRMMPIRWLHARLQRPTREAAASQGKMIELVTEEESTEMDRSVIEQVTDPLIHLLRNAVTHGIELPDDRVLAGKPPMGKIQVRAHHRGDLVFVDVEDDGAGLVPDHLRAALLDKEVLSADQAAELSDEEIQRLIFTSGFSTRDEVDEYAGRGVGLDVVHRNIIEMGGEITVKSTPGQGSLFSIQLPVSTAIAEALLFKVGEPVYAIPVSFVVETCFLEPDELRETDGQYQLMTRDEWIPLLYLHHILGGDPPLPLQRTRDPGLTQARQPVIVLQFGEARFGVTCTRVVGTREIVLKQLGHLLSLMPLFTGATISGSSKVQFVLDVGGLARIAQIGQRSWQRTAAFGQVQVDLARILIVDDSRSIRAAMEHILQSEGYAVDVAADGWEAWERLQLRTYDLLLTDLEMPRLHGLDLIAKCRKAPNLNDMPIMVLTSRTAEHSRRLAAERGADSFLAKPINRRLVLEQLRSLLSGEGLKNREEMDRG